MTIVWERRPNPAVLCRVEEDVHLHTHTHRDRYTVHTEKSFLSVVAQDIGCLLLKFSPWFWLAVNTGVGCLSVTDKDRDKSEREGGSEIEDKENKKQRETKGKRSCLLNIMSLGVNNESVWTDEV